MRRSWIPIALSLCLAAAPAVGDDVKKKPAASPAAKTADRAMPIASCIGAGPQLPVRASDSRTLLGPDDRDRVYEAILTRYPVLRGHQPAPRQIMLWRKGDEWLFVNLADRSATTSQAPPAPAELCFTATIVATDFDFTTALIQKYFLGGAAPA